MNLSRFDTRTASEEGQWLDILDWDWTTPTGFKVKVLGPDSMEAARIANDEEKEFQSRLASAFAKGKKMDDSDDELSVDKAIGKAVKITSAWEGAEWEGAELPLNAVNAEMLYSKCPHIRNQVLAFHNARSNFMKAGSSDSAKSSGSDSRSTSRAKKAR